MSRGPTIPDLKRDFSQQHSSRNFDILTSGEQDLASIFVLTALLASSEEIKAAGFEDKVVEFLDLNDFGEFDEWQQHIRQSGKTPDQVARNLSLQQFDFDDCEQTLQQLLTKGSSEAQQSDYGGAEDPFLNLIARHESAGNYNIAYGAINVPFTEMTIDEVLDWQRNYVNNGSPSSAAGRYQIINKTLKELKNELDLSGDELFDEEMQDRLAIELLERRGFSAYLEGEIPDSTFMKSLSQEWASLPKDMTGVSYYAGDGLNKALIAPQTLLAAMRHARNEYQQYTNINNDADNSLIKEQASQTSANIQFSPS